MRLWTVHPKYLDSKGLVALWREGLLAKAVLEGKTRGYRQHPQLVRFREQENPPQVVCQYLRHVLAESKIRGYRFDARKWPSKSTVIEPISEATGQLAYEWQHLLNKLSTRDPQRYRAICREKPEAHPLFKLIEGGVKSWENVA